MDTTTTLTFRKYSEDYFPYIAKWNSDDRISRSIGFEKIPTETETHMFVVSCANDRNSIFSVIELMEKPVGYFLLSNINNKHNTAELHVVIGENSNFLGVQVIDKILDVCFNVLDLHRVTTYVLSDNPKLINTAKKYGWTEEGIMKGMILMNGERLDYHVFRMLKEEFKKSCQSHSQ